MNLTSQSARQDDLLRWLSCSKIICNKKVIILLLYKKKKQMLENTGQQNFEKTRRKIDLAIFFNSPPTEMWYCMLSISLMQTSIIQNYSVSCHTVGLPLFHVLSCWWLHPELECPKLPHSLAQLIEQDSFSVVLNHPAPINNKDNKKTVLHHVIISYSII